jgi:two-component system, chemotaxis family, protein-glutamate methylesterase/glutaminase
MASLLRRTLAAGARIRVLVVDDSVVIRRLVAQALSEDPQIEVVGFAPDGAAALKRFGELHPDVITLDIEMPVMDGLETLRQLKALRAGPFVIMFSTLTERGALATIDALSLGASDYVAKAANAGSLDRSLQSLRRELVPKIKQFFVLPVIGISPVAATLERRAIPSAFRPRFLSARQAVAIGVSTGGPNALAEIIPMFPRGFGLPIFIVQHMPPIFTRLLAERLNTLTSLCVEEAADGALVEPGKVFIAPGDRHMAVCRRESGGVSIAINQDPPENSCRPSVDVLFRSVSDVYGGAVVAAVLTGMGYDGARGAEALHARGAYVIAQDEASSVVWGMPSCVVNAGAADAIVDLRCVVPEILSQV